MMNIEVLEENDLGESTCLVNGEDVGYFYKGAFYANREHPFSSEEMAAISGLQNFSQD